MLILLSKNRLWIEPPLFVIVIKKHAGVFQRSFLCYLAKTKFIVLDENQGDFYLNFLFDRQKAES